MTESKFFTDYKAMMMEGATIKKTAINPHFKSTYAPLPEVLAFCKELADKHNFIIIQYPLSDGLHTKLVHVSGVEIEGIIPLVTKDSNDPQKWGGALTYMRRYSLTCIFGLGEDDDDGNSASHSSDNKNSTESEKQGSGGGLASQKSIDFMVKLGHGKLNWQEVLDAHNVKRLSELTQAQVSKIIDSIKGAE